jgi:hypothetical protein
MATYKGKCGHRISKPGPNRVCRKCWRKRGAELPAHEKAEATWRGSVCGHPVKKKDAKRCKACDRRRGRVTPPEERVQHIGACGHPVSNIRAGVCRVCYAQRSLAASPDKVSMKGDTCEIEKTTSEKVRTIEDLIRVCEIDTATWDIHSWECKASQMMNVPRAVGESQNWHRESTEPVITQLFHVSARLKRKTPLVLTLEALRLELVQDIRAEVQRAKPARVPRRHVEGDYLFEFAPFDLHMGKYTWAEETVTNYDTDLAEDLFNAALDFLLSRALKLSEGRLARVLCVFGNDVSHMDGKKGLTTSGTPMDVDTRYIRVFRRICAIHRRAIDILRDVAPVDVKIVPGNHDEETSFHLGEILATRYEDVPHVTIDNSAKLRKYYDFGTNLFGFTHGDSERVTELPLLMAREQPELWARCASREWHIGHKHIKENHEHRPLVQDLHSDKGVRVRRLSSLSAHDAWHTKHAYTDRRACEGFVFHREAGFTDNLSCNVDHFTGKVLAE